MYKSYIWVPDKYPTRFLDSMNSFKMWIKYSWPFKKSGWYSHNEYCKEFLALIDLALVFKCISKITIAILTLLLVGSIASVRATEIEYPYSLKADMLIYPVTDTSSFNTEDLNTLKFEPYNLSVVGEQYLGYWVSIKVPPNPEDSILLVNTFFLDSIQVFKVENSQLVQVRGKHGYLIPPRERFFSFSTTSLVPLSASPKDSLTYFLRIYTPTTGGQYGSVSSFRMGFDLFDDAAFQKYYELPNMISIFMLGSLIIFIVFNLAIFIGLRNPSFGLLSLYNLSAVVWVFTFSGFWLKLDLVDNLEVERALRQMITFPPVILSYLLLSIKFLKLKTVSQILYRITLFLFIPIVSVEILYLFELYYWGNTIGILIFPFYYIVPIISAIKAIKRGIPYSRYFLLAATFMLSAILVFLGAYILGLYNYYYGHYYYQLCIFIELFIFSIAATQNILDERQKKMRLENEHLKSLHELEQKKRELLLMNTLKINDRRQLADLQKEVKSNNNIDALQEKTIRSIDKILKAEKDWEAFKSYFEAAHAGFMHRLEKDYSQLTQNDLRMCAFIKMGLKNKEIANIQGVTVKAVEKSKERIKKKIELEKSVRLNEFIADL